ncbi:MAG: 4a-hydroxytetrahydrobiopterin dehydratase [Gammaproteobacteria bacterium]|nr:4a-hydroxytetrahydrobiopterin dehydratase [Gammaproteobacteria bacterium]
MTKALEPNDLELRLRELNAAAAQPWKIEDGKLCRNFRFSDFAEAFGFMTRIAIYADKADHHPEWQNVYNRVSVQLVTHDAGGITDRDFALARRMENAAVHRSN